MNRTIGTGSGQMFRIHQDPDPKHILFPLLDLYRVFFFMSHSHQICSIKFRNQEIKLKMHYLKTF
jgi:hypothetical protein